MRPHSPPKSRSPSAQGLLTGDLPSELAAALDAHREARILFDIWSPSHRREIVRWVSDAKKPGTRALRADRSIAMILAKRPKANRPKP